MTIKSINIKNIKVAESNKAMKLVKGAATLTIVTLKVITGTL